VGNEKAWNRPTSLWKKQSLRNVSRPGCDAPWAGRESGDALKLATPCRTGGLQVDTVSTANRLPTVIRVGLQIKSVNGNSNVSQRNSEDHHRLAWFPSVHPATEVLPCSMYPHLSYFVSHSQPQRPPLVAYSDPLPPFPRHLPRVYTIFLPAPDIFRSSSTALPPTWLLHPVRWLLMPFSTVFSRSGSKRTRT